MTSIIIPNHNGAATLGRCIRSVREQTFRDWECIIVDDGSTDDSIDIIRRAVAGNPRFTIITNNMQARGVAYARNVGVLSADGDSLFFVDSDDWIERNALQFAVSEAKAHPEAGRIVVPDYLDYPERGWSWKHIISPIGLHGPESPHMFSGPDCDTGHATGCLYLLDRIPCELQFPDVRIFEDMIFNMGLMFAGMSTYITNKHLYRYVRHDGSLLSSTLTEIEAWAAMETLTVLAQKYNPKPEVYERCLRFLNNALANRIEKNG